MSRDSKQANQTSGQHGKSENPGLLDRFGSFWLRFRRFGLEFLGVGIIALGVISILAILGITQGRLVSPWEELLTRLFGWGSILFAILLVVAGIQVVRLETSVGGRISLSRILLIELLFFEILAFLSLLGKVSVERTEQGLDGGLVGWGIARIGSGLFSDTGALIFVVLFFILTLYYIFGLNRVAGKWIEKWILADTPTASESDINLDDDIDANLSQVKAIESIRGNHLPPLNLLSNENANRPDEEHITLTAERIERTLNEFGVPSKVVGYRIGPTVTQFAVEPGYIERTGSDGIPMKQKVRVAQISSLSKDLALSLSAQRLRIEAPVPGRTFVGIEVPNLHISTVRLRAILESGSFGHHSPPLLIALGRDVSGQPLVADLARMPHLLIAGTTGSGKSVCISAITICMVLNNSPETLRLAMLDPKMVELIRFNGLPHLMGKVETELERMLAVLRWTIEEMDRRYKVFEQAGARDLEAFNRKMERRNQPKLPRIVLLIDELADLMLNAPEQSEHALIRLAQMARATGIHLVVATQRPSTDVVTGLIKANFPARISFSVASSVDSRVVLDMNGAETLLGKGDMLFLNPEVGSPIRAQGVMVTDQEIERVIGYWRRAAPEVEAAEGAPWEQILQEQDDEADSLVEQAARLVRNSQRASASMLQRKLRIGYPRAARLLDELEEMGVVGPSMGGGRERDVLLPRDETETDSYDEL